MIETKRRCDYCGATPALEIHYNYRRIADAAGSMETDYDTVDLCCVHAADRLQDFLKAPPLALIQTEKDHFSSFAKISCQWKPKVGTA